MRTVLKNGFCGVVFRRFLSVSFCLFSVVFLLLGSCAKEKASEPQPISNGMGPGECRFKLMSDTAMVVYDNLNRITKVASFTYSYSANLVQLKDPTIYKQTYDFALNAKGYPVNVGLFEPGDTAARELTWFNYNADSTLALSRTFVWVKDRYFYSTKTVYTYTNKNLTQMMAFGPDSSKGQLTINLAYDITKLDKRKANFEKMYAFEPYFSVGFMPKSYNLNLITEMQVNVTGNTPIYYAMGYLYDAKGNITTETISVKGGAMVYEKRFAYECNN
ncbi:MAG: hypothetical protein SGJ00_06520 [bacterium]|nr:hypothetical protein [bacterium]